MSTPTIQQSPVEHLHVARHGYARAESEQLDMFQLMHLHLANLLLLRPQSHHDTRFTTYMLNNPSPIASVGKAHNLVLLSRECT
jgi:hypothetical protein